MEEILTQEMLADVAFKYLDYPSILYNGEDKGKDPRRGFDCSGFIVHLIYEIVSKVPKHLDNSGIIRPTRHCRELFDYYGIPIHQEFRTRGDLVFFSRNGILPTHVGVYVGNNEMIHAPGITNSKVSAVLLDDYITRFDYSKDFVGSNQIYNRGVIGYKRASLTKK